MDERTMESRLQAALSELDLILSQTQRAPDNLKDKDLEGLNIEDATFITTGLPFDQGKKIPDLISEIIWTGGTHLALEQIRALLEKYKGNINRRLKTGIIDTLNHLVAVRRVQKAPEN